MMTSEAAPRRNRRRGERGATLIIGMILLLLLSVLSLTSLKAIKTDERMAGNLQDRYLAFQAAEAALREAEALLSEPSLPSFTPANGFYRYDQSGVPAAFDFTTANAREYSRDLGAVAHRPRYILEQMEGRIEEGVSLVVGGRYGISTRANYRITAIGFGGSAQTRVVLQTTYRR